MVAAARFAVGMLALAGCGRIGFDAAGGDGVVPDAAPDAPRLQLEAGACPPDYMATSTSCYRVAQDPADWLTAERDCESDVVGAHLVVIADNTEAQMLRTILDEAQDFWIGAIDLVAEGTYVSVTGMPATYLDWGAAEPDGGEEDCLYVEEGEINDDECIAEYPYACEYDGLPADPATYMGG